MDNQRSRSHFFKCLIYINIFFIYLFLKPVLSATINRGSGNDSPCKLNCPVPLTLDFHCGSNGITYLNLQELMCAKSRCFPDLQPVRRGKCQALGGNSVNARDPKKTDTTGTGVVSVKSCESECSCPETVDKMCGTDGQTYQNQCYLNCRKTCSKIKDLEKHHDGACGRLFFPDNQDPDYVEYVDDDDI